MYLYETILSLWITKKFGSAIEANTLLENLIKSLERVVDYVSALENCLLKIMSYDNKTESGFILILGASLMYALTANSNFATHKGFTEMHTRYGKNIDIIYLPLKHKKQLLLSWI